jgi:carbon monoxide dehydrogenase subunit G
MATHPVHPPEWIDTAPIIVERSIEIDASPAEVWRHIADHERWPEWFGAISKVEVTGDPTGVGGKRCVTVKGGASLDEVFTAWDENERFAFAVVGSKVPFLVALAESVDLEPADDRCRVTYRQGIEVRRGLRWGVGQMTNSIGKRLARALDQLRLRAESSHPHP